MWLLYGFSRKKSCHTLTHVDKYQEEFKNENYVGVAFIWDAIKIEIQRWETVHIKEYCSVDQRVHIRWTMQLEYILSSLESDVAVCLPTKCADLSHDLECNITIHIYIYDAPCPGAKNISCFHCWRIQIYIPRVADRYAQVKVCIARLHTHHMAHAYKYSDRLCDVQ